ncbi:uncharacterized protein LOC143453461 isoform X2 [Clavelina lepadiformis]|uniref:uncharacterized protein LOC143453461 isoform X2 n=1 Tax=Clavelina lepadiformis TaxID=159417 RepID=UPI004041AFB9
MDTIGFTEEVNKPEENLSEKVDVGDELIKANGKEDKVASSGDDGGNDEEEGEIVDENQDKNKSDDLEDPNSLMEKDKEPNYHVPEVPEINNNKNDDVASCNIALDGVECKEKQADDKFSDDQDELQDNKEMGHKDKQSLNEASKSEDKDTAVQSKTDEDKIDKEDIETKEDGTESDGEIVDSDVNDDDELPQVQEKIKVDYGGVLDEVRPELDQLDYDEDEDDLVDAMGVPPQEGTKSVEEKAKKEMSDGEIESSDGEIKSDNEAKVSRGPHQGFYPDDFEEGEMVDPVEGPAVPREICRFFERGSCTWGDRCRFIHPGINDKGGYNMFDDRKRANMLNEQRPPPAADAMMPPHGMPTEMTPGPRIETAWERGLRHAKEMRKKSMQRKVNEPDFLRKREVISLNEALNVDRDMDYIAHKPLVEDARGFDPFNAFDDDDRYAVPPPEELKKFKRFDKSQGSRGRSPVGNMPSHHPDSQRARMDKERNFPPPGHPLHREMLDRHGGGDRRSPSRHVGPPHPQNRHQPPPMHARDHRMPPHPRSDDMFRDLRGDGGMQRNHPDRGYRDHRMDDARREVESRVVAVGHEGSNPTRKPQKSMKSFRGDNWSDPWARGRQSAKKRSTKSGSDSSSGSSSSSSSRSSDSSRSSSGSSRSSSRSSYSSSFSSSGSSRSPSPKKNTKKVLKKKAALTKTATGKEPTKPVTKSGKVPATAPKQVVKKTVDPAAKLKAVKVPQQKPAVKLPIPALKPPAKVKAPQQQRGRQPTKAPTKKSKPKRRSHSSSSSEFSHTSSSESRSRSRSKGSGSDSGSSSSSSGSSSGSDSYTSSSGSSFDSSDEDTKKKPVKKGKAVPVKKPAAPAAAKKPVAGKVSVPSKPGRKDVKMTIINKAKPAAPTTAASKENRKRPAAAMSGTTKKVSAIANRRVELLEQLKVVENAIMKKRAKLT